MRTVWLASYPKSGNTWMRLLLANLAGQDDTPADLNALPGAIASSRRLFEQTTLIDSTLLGFDEIDALRPRVYAALAMSASTDDDDQPAGVPVRFVKVHDAYCDTAAGEALLGGDRGAGGAVVIVRDPRDVAPSLAHHMGFDIDRAIGFMSDAGACFCGDSDRAPGQLRQKLTSWSAHAASWLGQRDVPVHLVRYEDLQRAPAATFRAALAFAGWPATDAAIERAVRLSAFEGAAALERAHGFREAPNDEPFFRRGRTGGWRDELSTAQVARIERDHAPMMQRLGYAPVSLTRLAAAG